MSDASDPSSPDEALAADATADLGFEEAMEELETLVARLQDEAISIDDLGDGVARGAALIKLCRDRLARAETQVREVIDSLDTDGADDVDEPGDPAAGADDEARGSEASSSDTDDVPF